MTITEMLSQSRLFTLLFTCAVILIFIIISLIRKRTGKNSKNAETTVNKAAASGSMLVRTDLQENEIVAAISAALTEYKKQT